MADYVIVGAGSAGCVLASRLSEDPDTEVVLLEAGGPDRRREIHIPALFGQLFKTDCDWAYTTEPQPALNNRILYWPRGKMLGGSSSMNAMIYIRGHPSDYDGWRELGNLGWGYGQLLPYFLRAERQARGSSQYHNADGPLAVDDLRTINPMSRAFVEACVQVGIARNPDFNGASQEGVGFYQVTQQGGRRCSAAAAYLTPARRRKNLRVVTGAHARRVVFDGVRAVGVEYSRAGASCSAPERIDARREVILAAGAVNSPQLLLLSGVGPRRELEALGIRVVADLPGVGANLQDHLAVAACYASREPISLAGADALRHVVHYLLFHRGPLTSNVAEAGAFVRSKPELTAPDLQLIFAPAYYIEHGFVRPPGHGFSIGVCLLRPRSRGRIALRSADPLAPPRIDPGYLSDAGDLLVLEQGVRLARVIARAPAFDRHRGEEHLPALRARGDEAATEVIRATAQTLYHPVGSCRMGVDDEAAVDHRLCVRGLQHLRVADASIMPTIVGGNTNAPVIMIAERAVDLIRG